MPRHDTQQARRRIGLWPQGPDRNHRHAVFSHISEAGVDNEAKQDERLAHTVIDTTGEVQQT